jgi:hypothetical protein
MASQEIIYVCSCRYHQLSLAMSTLYTTKEVEEPTTVEEPTKEVDKCENEKASINPNRKKKNLELNVLLLRGSFRSLIYNTE